MKKAKLQYASVMKTIDVILPDELKEDYRNSFTICKDVINGVKDQCEGAYTLLKCIQKNNPTFVFT